MYFQQFEYDSHEYRLAWTLRNQLLRKPLGLDLLDEKLADEAEQLHYGLFRESQIGEPELLSCVIAAPTSSKKVRLRQMAVVPSLQGQGRGRQLLSEVEQQLKQKGFREIHLHARVAAQGFYEKLGYDATGDEFVELGIAHIEMQKLL